MSNADLLKTGYARTHQAADAASRLATETGADSISFNSPEIIALVAEWSRHLLQATAAVQELEMRSRGHRPPQ